MKKLILLLIMSSILENHILSQTIFQEGIDSSRLSCVQKTFDNGFVFLGTKYYDILLLKTDLLGDTIWTKTFDFDGNYFANDQGLSLQQTIDSGFIISGSSQIDSVHKGNFTLIKTNSQGEKQWAKVFDFGFTDTKGSSVFQTNDGGYIVVGTNQNFSLTFRNGIILKTDSLGNLVWCKIIGQPSSTNITLNSFTQTFDGGYVFDWDRDLFCNKL